MFLAEIPQFLLYKFGEQTVMINSYNEREKAI